MLNLQEHQGETRHFTKRTVILLIMYGAPVVGKRAVNLVKKSKI